jgi:hypothetical protein
MITPTPAISAVYDIEALAQLALLDAEKLPFFEGKPLRCAVVYSDEAEVYMNGIRVTVDDGEKEGK